MVRDKSMMSPGTRSIQRSARNMNPVSMFDVTVLNVAVSSMTVMEFSVQRNPLRSWLQIDGRRSIRSRSFLTQRRHWLPGFIFCGIVRRTIAHNGLPVDECGTGREGKLVTSGPSHTANTGH